MNELEIQKILQKEELLSNHGIGAYDTYQIYTNDVDNESFRAQRYELLSKGKQIEACVKWLRKFDTTETMNLSIGSSEILKTYVEKEYKIYVTNGAFIAALIYLDIPFESFLNYPFVNVGIKMVDEMMDILN